MERRKMISCHKGLSPIAVPESWLVGFDPSSSFGMLNDAIACIRFPNGLAFGNEVENYHGKIFRYVWKLSKEDIDEIQWRSFGPPWETYITASLFGHGPVTNLDEVV